MHNFIALRMKLTLHEMWPNECYWTSIMIIFHEVKYLQSWGLISMLWFVSCTPYYHYNQKMGRNFLQLNIKQMITLRKKTCFTDTYILKITNMHIFIIKEIRLFSNQNFILNCQILWDKFKEYILTIILYIYIYPLLCFSQLLESMFWVSFFLVSFIY